MSRTRLSTKTGSHLSEEQIKKIDYRKIDYIKNTGGSSSRFGVCEICGKHVSEVWLRRIVHTYIFGHRRCIVADDALLKAGKI
jgi:hypothetical protein